MLQGLIGTFLGATLALTCAAAVKVHQERRGSQPRHTRDAAPPAAQPAPVSTTTPKALGLLAAGGVHSAPAPLRAEDGDRVGDARHALAPAGPPALPTDNLPGPRGKRLSSVDVALWS